MSKYDIDGHKMQYHLDRVYDWQVIPDKSKVFPLYVEVSPVGQCNHRCSFCAVDYIGYVNRKLQTEKLKHAIMQMSNSGVRSIMFAGEGEPMLHPDIREIVQHTYEYDIDIAFTTNGTMMNEAFVKGEMCFCTWIKVSINGGDRDTYSKIHHTKPEHWELVWKNLTMAVQERDRFKTNLTIGVQTLLLPDNAQSIEQLAKKCAETGVDYLVIKPYSQGTKSITTQYADIKYDHIYDAAIQPAMQFVSSKFEIITRRDSMEGWDAGVHTYTTCPSTPFFWAYIMATGDVYGCSAHLLDERFRYGNIHDDEFNNIWLGEKRKASIELMKTFDVSQCRLNCRMDKVNKFLWDVKHPGKHKNFI